MAVPAAAQRALNRAPSAFADPWPWALAAAYAAVFFALGSMRYAAHRNFVDLGIFTQTAVSAFGCFCNTVEGSHWAFHFSPILYVAGALTSVWRSALALVALQAVAGALTIPPVYAIVARHADRRIARLAAIVVFLYPPLAGVTFNDFHENGLAPAAVAWMLWAFDAGRAGWTALFALLTLSIKEDQALFVAIAGALACFRYRGDRVRMRLAAAAACMAVVVFAVYFLAIQPHANVNPQWSPSRFYAWTPRDWRSLFPAGLADRAGFLALAFVPLLFIPFRTPVAWITIAPLGEVLASRMPTTYTMGSHYAGAWAGWVFFALCAGIVQLWAHSPQKTQRVLYWCIALCAVEFALADPLHPGYFLRAQSAQDGALNRFIAALPRDISVATQEEAYTHLAATDPKATVLPETPNQAITACYILVDAGYPNSPRLVESAPLIARLTAQGAFVPVRRDGAITLYKSRACR